MFFSKYVLRYLITRYPMSRPSLQKVLNDLGVIVGSCSKYAQRNYSAVYYDKGNRFSEVQINKVGIMKSAWNKDLKLMMIMCVKTSLLTL